jgi:hypothetical protein
MIKVGGIICENIMNKNTTTEVITTDENVFPKRWMKVLESIPEFREIADAASKDDLDKIILQCEGNIYVVDKEKESDVKLNAAKELVKDYMGPYREAVKVQTAKIKYALFLLEGKGDNLDNQ